MTLPVQAGAFPILQDDEPHPLETCNPEGASDYFIICEHAGRLIPRAYGDMGLSAVDLERSIPWDIGAKQVSLELSAMLDAPLFTQR